MSLRSLRAHASSILALSLAAGALAGCQGSDDLTSAHADSSVEEAGAQDSTPAPDATDARADATPDARPDSTLDARPDSGTDALPTDSARADGSADSRSDVADTTAPVDAPDTGVVVDSAPLDDTAVTADTAPPDDTAVAVDTAVADTAALDTAEACAVNLCGGCGVLAGDPTTRCGTCGTYVCSVDLASVSCVEGPLNGCGVCGPEPTPPPRQACGSCGTGSTTCDASGLTTSCIGGEPVSGTDFSYDPAASPTISYAQFGVAVDLTQSYAVTYNARHTGSFTEVDLRIAIDAGLGATTLTLNFWQDTVGAPGTLLATINTDRSAFPVFVGGTEPPMHPFVFATPTKQVTAGTPVWVELVFSGSRSSWIVAADTTSPAADYQAYSRLGTEAFSPTTEVPYMTTLMNACF